MRTVREIMSVPAVTANPSESISDISARMAKHGVGSIVVVDDNSFPIGLWTERDFVRFTAGAADPASAKIADWMIKEPDLLDSNNDIEAAYSKVKGVSYCCVPVVDDGKIAGIVSKSDLLKYASISRVVPPEASATPKGLSGVVVAETEIGDVRGQEGFYHYRQYSAVDLARNLDLEEVWYHLIHGQLPSASQRAAFADEIRALANIPTEIKALLHEVSQATDDPAPLNTLRTAISIVAQWFRFKPSLDISHEELMANGLQICAIVPSLIAALHRIRNGQEIIDPRPDLGYTANYLYMISGEVPAPEVARAIEQYQILTIDHGFNASTFTARVIISTGADVGAAMAGAVGALSGPLHGGAPSRALDMLHAIREPANARPWVREMVQNGERIMGFGHRVYKTHDPRSLLLREVAQRLGGDLVELAVGVETAIEEVLAELKPGRELYANVEYYAAVVMNRCGLPPELFTPTFASSRVIGWSAHILEQASDNRIIRPSARYVGPQPPQPLP